MPEQAMATSVVNPNGIRFPDITRNYLMVYQSVCYGCLCLSWQLFVRFRRVRIHRFRIEFDLKFAIEF